MTGVCTRGLFGVVALAWLTMTASGLANEAPQRYDGHQVVRVFVPDAEKLGALLEVTDDVWSERVGVGWLDVRVSPAQRVELDALGLDYIVWIEDVQALADAQRQAAGRAWFDTYHTYAEITGFLEGLALAYPNLAEVIDIGTTLEGRPIKALHIAGPDVNAFSPAAVYFASVHAREWIAATVPQYLGEHLLSNYGTDPVVTDLVNRVEWFLVPVANPDGYVYTWGPDRMWRKNRRDNLDGNFGVDINRNWSVGWGSDTGSSGRTYSGTYRGPAPFSEPETRALRDLFLDHPNVRVQMDIHSYSQLLLWPWGHKAELAPDHATYSAVGQVMQQLIQAVHGKTYDIGSIYSGIYPVSGDSLDWTYQQRGIFSMTFELRDTGVTGFLLPADQIIPNNQEVLPAMLYLTGTDPVLATQINLLDGGAPEALYAGVARPVNVGVTSAVDEIDPTSVTLHYRLHPDVPFTDVPMDQVNGAQFDALLPATHCAAQPEWYFSVMSSNGTVTANPVDAPATTFSATMLSGGVIFEELLDADPGWVTEGQWAFGQPTGDGGVHGEPDPDAGHTGLYVYGYNLNGDYTNVMPEYRLTSTPIDCTGQAGLRLSFWRWLGVEEPTYDHASVQISNDGVNWTVLWQNTGEVADDDWLEQDFDIASVADDQPTVYLRWTLGPTDTGWAYCGWNIDDIRIYATGCLGQPGDANGDRTIDAADLALFVPCLGGAGEPAGAGCAVFDLTGDGEVNLRDYAAMQTAVGQMP